MVLCVVDVGMIVICVVVCSDVVAPAVVLTVGVGGEIVDVVVVSE